MGILFVSDNRISEKDTDMKTTTNRISNVLGEVIGWVYVNVIVQAITLIISKVLFAISPANRANRFMVEAIILITVAIALPYVILFLFGAFVLIHLTSTIVVALYCIAWIVGVALWWKWDSIFPAKKSHH